MGRVEGWGGVLTMTIVRDNFSQSLCIVTHNYNHLVEALCMFALQLLHQVDLHGTTYMIYGGQVE